MRAAATQVSIQSFSDLHITWMRSFPKQRRRCDDHSVKAVPALRRLFLKERTLHRMVLSFLDQSFQGCDSRPAHLGDWKLAGWLRLIPDQHHTGATCLLAAAELGTCESQFIAQNIKERGIPAPWTACRFLLTTSTISSDMQVSPG